MGNPLLSGWGHHEISRPREERTPEDHLVQPHSLLISDKVSPGETPKEGKNSLYLGLAPALQCLLRKRFLLILSKISQVTICGSCPLLYHLAPMGWVWLTAPSPLFTYSFLPGQLMVFVAQATPDTIQGLSLRSPLETEYWGAGDGGTTQPHGFVSCFHCWTSFEIKLFGAESSCWRVKAGLMWAQGRRRGPILSTSLSSGSPWAVSE